EVNVPSSGSPPSTQDSPLSETTTKRCAMRLHMRPRPSLQVAASSEGTSGRALAGVHASFYDLFRVAERKLGGQVTVQS
ncbi:MAG: hypothetical protein WBN10_05515, partial [Polyangiales bacterium]